MICEWKKTLHIIAIPFLDPELLSIAQVQHVPLAGAWVAGVASSQSPHVWAAALHFCCSRSIPCRGLANDGAFLMLIFSIGDPARVYHCNAVKFASKFESHYG